MEDLINARCGWAGTDELYIKYHDEEWGQPPFRLHYNKHKDLNLVMHRAGGLWRTG